MDAEARRAANARRNRAHYARNAERLREKSRAHRRANPGCSTQYVRAWRARNPELEQAYRKADHGHRRARGGDFTAQDWLDLLEEFDHACAYCSARDVELVQEHMTPLARGGRHTKSNVVPACRRCNGRKHTQTLLEFAAKKVA